MKKKIFLSVILALAMMLVSVFTLTGCGNNNDNKDDNKDDDKVVYHPDDTSFEGAISEDSYDTVNDAASAFIENEICGKTTQATFVSYTKEKDLTESEIAELNLGDGYEVSEVESAESGNAKFTESSASRAADSSATKNARVYIIKIGSRYFYYVPIFKTGELITKSYISEILDYTKYVNVTETAVTKSTSSAQGMTITATITTTTKVTENAIHLKMETSVLGATETTEFYIVAKDNELVTFMQYGGEWVPAGTGYTSVEEFLEQAFAFDHTYFERTDWGFKLTSEKLDEYLNDVMTSVAAMGGTVTEGSANYYVKDGKLDSVDAKIKMNVYSDGVSVTATADGHTTYTNYGTTVVNVPAEITAMLAAE